MSQNRPKPRTARLVFAQFGALLAVLPLLLNTAAGADDPALRSRFFSDAPRGWAALRQRTLHAEGAGIKESLSLSKPDAPRRTLVEFKMNGDWKRIVMTGTTSRKQSVMCLNSRYGFGLRREPESDAFIVTKLRPQRVYMAPSPGLDFSRDLSAMDLAFLQFLNAPWNMDGHSLAELISTEGFTLKTVGAASDDGRLVEIVFSYIPANPKQTVYDEARVVLSPEHDWGVREYQCKVSGGILTGTVEYRTGSDGESLPHRVIHSVQADSGDGSEDRFEFHTLTVRQIPEAEFTFSAFGLPEPADDRRRGWHAGVWLLLTGFICLLAAVPLWRLARRDRSAARPSSASPAANQTAPHD